MKRALVAIALVGLAGEWVTRSDTGERVCRLRYDMQTYQALPLDFCEDWQNRSPPMYGERLPRSWFRCGDRAPGCQIHIENRGWRP